MNKGIYQTFDNFREVFEILQNLREILTKIAILRN